MVHNALGGDDQIIITPWRHLKLKGAIGLDMAVHYADIVQYYLGLPLESYRERFKTFPDSIEATGEDSVVALYRMKSGAMVQFSYVAGGRGSRSFERSVHGRPRAMYAPGDRNGRPVILRLEGQEIRGKDLLAPLPNFQLTEITERLFGPKDVEYDLPFAAIDATHLAIEYQDFAASVLAGRQPAVAAILGAYESALAGRLVSMDELLSNEVSGYQEEIDVALGLSTPVLA
jgi:predicted dehydrogenase